MHQTSCIVGNSSSAIREGAFIGTPAVNVGTRQVSRQRGRNVRDVGYDRKQIIEAIERQMKAGPFPSEPIYGDGKAGERIANILANCPLHIQKKITY
jgi:UDP-N-acetylglucosamine 2-epimerase